MRANLMGIVQGVMIMDELQVRIALAVMMERAAQLQAMIDNRDYINRDDVMRILDLDKPEEKESGEDF